MRINEFFETILNARVALLYSWGAVDHGRHRVFLRLWNNQANLDFAKGRILVLDQRNQRAKQQQNERVRQLALAKSGYELYGVLCTYAENASATDAKIEAFDSEQLLKLGRLVEQTDGQVFAEIEAIVPISNLAVQSNVTNDIEALVADKSLNFTTRTALIQARLGQGVFRQRLLRKYKNSCAVTLCQVTELLRASHVKPWSVSTNQERLDPNNGILLTANLDALFDSGLISFDGGGELLQSTHFQSRNSKIIGKADRLQSAPTARQRGFLEYHRNNIFRVSKET